MAHQADENNDRDWNSQKQQQDRTHFVLLMKVCNAESDLNHSDTGVIALLTA
jgi:hypothetical protein